MPCYYNSFGLFSERQLLHLLTGCVRCISWIRRSAFRAALAAAFRSSRIASTSKFHIFSSSAPSSVRPNLSQNHRARNRAAKFSVSRDFRPGFPFDHLSGTMVELTLAVGSGSLPDRVYGLLLMLLMRRFLFALAVRWLFLMLAVGWFDFLLGPEWCLLMLAVPRFLRLPAGGRCREVLGRGGLLEYGTFRRGSNS